MREFLHKSNFFNYLSGINFKPTQKYSFIPNILAFYFLLFFFMFGTIFSSSVSSMICAFVGAILFISGAQLGMFRNAKPNLATLMPVSYKRRIVYDFLGAIVCTIIVLLVILLIFLIGFLIGIIASSLTGGITPDEDDADTVVKLFGNIGVYGGIFCAIYCLITYSAGLLSSYFKRRKHRNIFLLCFVIALALGTTLSGIPYVLHAPEAAGRFGILLPFVSDCYKYMAVPWLCTLFWCIAAAAMFAASIYFGYKYHKPKAF